MAKLLSGVGEGLLDRHSNTGSRKGVGGSNLICYDGRGLSKFGSEAVS